MGRGISWVVLVASAQLAVAQPKKDDALVGAQPVLTASASSGFIDDVVAADGDRFAYVVADGNTKAALHIAAVGSKDEKIFDIAAVTLQPIALQLVAGERVFVVGVNEGKQVAALVELGDKARSRKRCCNVYELGPADHITVITRDGKQRVAVHTQTEAGGIVKHAIDLRDLATGARIGKGKVLALDASGEEKKLEFRVNHWSDGWTRAHGIKAGQWDKKEDQRGPDQEATFDLVTGRLEKQKIVDLFDQKRRFAALVDAGGKLDFLRLPPNMAGIELWRAGKMTPVVLDQKLTDYDLKTMQHVVNADGTGWLALKVDPVNADAVARKKADPEYLDIFRISADGKATRKARVLAKGLRHRFGVAGDRFWLIERNAGFERGGKTVTLYQLQ